MGFGQRLKDVRYPMDDNFPFGSFQVQLIKLEQTNEKSKGGEYKDYFNWKLLIVKKRHSSAMSSEGVIVTLKRGAANDFGLSDNKMIAQAFTDKSREEFDQISAADIDAYLDSLTEENCKAKVRQCVLEVNPDNKGYPKYHAYRIQDAPAVPYVFDPATAPDRQASTTETAASEAGKGTPAAPPARSSL